MKRFRLLPLLLAAALLLGCTPGVSAGGAVRIAAPAAEAVRGMKKDGSSTGERETLAEGYREALSAFCVRAAREGLGTAGQENALISPVSLYFAAAALAGAAEGETRAELLRALGMERALAESETAKLRTNMNIDDAMGKLAVAGSLWLADAFAEALDTEAAEALADAYGMEIWRADLADAAAAEALADWVQEHTNGLLGDAAGFELDPETALTLLNAVYYKDEWINRFNAEKTEAAVFHNADGSETTCDFLNATYGVHGFSRYENGALGCTISSLQLKHGAMTFILPDAGCTPEDILADEAALAAIASGNCESGVGEVVWKIPKFDYAADTDLAPALRAMGVTAAFDPELADFTALLSAEVELPLWVSGVRQQARISVNEDGVEAAGYTQINFAGSPMPDGRADMILDRPFLYYISAEGGMLFAGIVNRM